MAQQEYIAFIEAFESLSPYELDHLCHIIHQHYQALPDEAKANIGRKEIWKIMTSAMQTAHIEEAEQKLKEAELNLQFIKSKLYRCPNS